MSASIGIYVFPEVEVLDFAGPFEAFTTASRIAVRRSPGTPAPFSVFSVASREGPVRTRAGLVVQPDFTFTNHPPIDLLIVPGGVVTAEQAKPEVLRWLQETSVAARITASVCTGVFLLAQGGIVRAHRVTTHWEDINDLRSQFPDLQVIEHLRWVDDGQYVTSAGISAGIDMSVHLVERIAGRALAEATARQMEFDWRENA